MRGRLSGLWVGLFDGLCGTLDSAKYEWNQAAMAGNIEKVAQIQFENPKAEKALNNIRRWSHYLDRAFRVPGTKMRFGWDPILGLIPGLGDISVGLFAFFILIQAFRLKVPGIIRARMILNTLIDVLFGAIPVIGDVFDFVWKSSTMNLALLEKHAVGGIKPQNSDYFFVLGILAAGLASVLIPLAILNALLYLLEKVFLRGPLF